MHLELFLVWDFNRLCPCGWGFEFFSLRFPVVFLRERHAGHLTWGKVLVVVQVTTFLSSRGELVILLLVWGAGTFP
jgi:hypothetical protein